MKYLLILTLSVSTLYSQNRPPIANDDSTDTGSVNCLANDSDPDNDALRILDYQIDGNKYYPTSPKTNFKRSTPIGNIIFKSDGTVIYDSIATIMYRISDGNYGVDTAYIKFYKAKPIPGDTSKFIHSNTAWFGWEHKVNCTNNPNGQIKVSVQDGKGGPTLEGVLKPNDWVYVKEPSGVQHSFIIPHNLAVLIENEGCRE